MMPALLSPMMARNSLMPAAMASFNDNGILLMTHSRIWMRLSISDGAERRFPTVPHALHYPVGEVGV
jgi:hypothetical protein